MKRVISVLYLLSTAVMASAVGQTLPAFPGAKGGGMFTTGGRGGKVVKVTNLNDAGAGSFREAVNGNTSKIVVFDVGGVIELNSDVVIGSNTTVAGQTAPGGAGVTVKNYKIGLGGTNTIVRFISSRPGERGTNADYDAMGGANGANSIIDHCAFGWANDEQWGLYSQNNYQTVQYSVIGPSNSFSYHSKGIHGFGIMLGRANVSWDHNLIAHNVSRNFRGKVPGTEIADFTNNVVYNWAYETTYGTIGRVNFAGNTFKRGNSTTGGNRYVSIDNSGTAPENYRLYLAGNRFLNRDNTQYSNYTDNNWAGVAFNSEGRTEANTKLASPLAIMSNGVNVSTVASLETAEAAYNNVLNFAGPGVTGDKRPPIDKQVAEETRTGTGYLTGGRPLSQANESQAAEIAKYNIKHAVYQYPANYLTKEIVDTDNDGMPDEWERARGLDPAKYDANGDYAGQGYNNIEYYINDLTINAFPPGVVTLSPTKSTSAVNKIIPSSYTMSVVNINSGMLRVNYIIKDKGNVRIDLFDVKGVRVKTFVNTSKNPGAYREHISTNGLSAGMYIIKLRTGGTVLQERVAVIR